MHRSSYLATSLSPQRAARVIISQNRVTSGYKRIETSRLPGRSAATAAGFVMFQYQIHPELRILSHSNFHSHLIFF